MAKKILMVVAHDDYQDWEYEKPREIFLANDFEVQVGSTEKTPAHGTKGGQCQVDLLLDEVKVDNFDAMVLIGGPGAEVYQKDQKMLELVRSFDQAKKVVAAICIAPTILAQAGILQDKEATVHPSGDSYFRGCGIKSTGEAITISGNCITGSGPAAAEQFAKSIIEKLK